MTQYHKELAAGRWAQLSFAEQMANIGSDIERAINWRTKNNIPYSQRAFDRALELLDLTLSNPSGYPRLRELSRVREALVDHFCFSNEYKSTEESWRKYFLAFTYIARRNH